MDLRIESPFPAHAYPRVWGWIETFRSRVLDDFSPQSLPEYLERCLADSDRLKTWAVYRDGELGGMVTFEQWNPMLGTCHCLFKKALWGRAVTLPALQQIAQEIFTDTKTTKIAMCVFHDNRPIRSLLTDLGAVIEGTYKAHTMRNGKPCDMIAFALFKDQFEDKLNATISDSSRDRRNQFDSGRSAVQPSQDVHADGDAHAVAGDTGAREPPPAVQPGQHDEPASRIRPDPLIGNGCNQPQLHGHSRASIGSDGGAGIR